MTYLNRIKRLLWAAGICLLLHAACYPVMPVSAAMAEQTNRISLIAVGGVYWASALAGYALLFAANIVRRTFVREKMRGNYRMGCRIGLFTFFANGFAIAADVALFVSAAGLLVLLLLGQIDRYLSYILLFFLSFSLHMHGVLNGRLYKITKYKPIRRKKHA